MKEDRMSFIVVTKGPAATAGSRPPLRNIIGIRVPIRLAVVMPKQTEKKMIFAKMKGSKLLPSV